MAHRHTLKQSGLIVIRLPRRLASAVHVSDSTDVSNRSTAEHVSIS